MDRVEHEGRIVAVDQYSIKVEIISKSACSACHAKGVCSAAEAVSKMVDVPVTVGMLAQHYEIGEEVILSLKQSMGMNATILAYGIPLLVLVATMIIASGCGANDLWVGIFSIISVIFYYLVLSFFKDKLSNDFTFTIAKQTK